MFRVAICDDVKEICDTLDDTIRKCCEKECVATRIDVFLNTNDLYQNISTGEEYDLIFLDIEFPDEMKSGIELGQMIRGERKDNIVQIVFISGKDCYCRELLELQPLHFLQKPYTAEQVENDVVKAIDQVNAMRAGFRYVKDKQQYRVRIGDILFFELRSPRIRIRHKMGEDFFYGSWNDIVCTMQDFRFVRTAKSFLVHYDYIRKIGTTELELENGERIPVSRKYKESLKKRQIEFESEYHVRRVEK